MVRIGENNMSRWVAISIVTAFSVDGALASHFAGISRPAVMSERLVDVTLQPPPDKRTIDDANLKCLRLAGER
jgi:hypothetical protein